MKCKHCDTKRSRTDGSFVDNICSNAELLKDLGYDFCPKCGEPLTEPVPLTLEQLREMDGRAMFTKTNGVIGSGRWELIHFDEHWIYFKTIREDYKMTYAELEGSYGKTWLAYTHKPKEQP